MARKAFYSFHYQPDNWRASQVRQMGVLEGNRPCSDNDWESVVSRGEAAIKNWIGEQLSGKSCIVVLVGSKTAGRKWINYEIEKAWTDGKGVVGVHIHDLKNSTGDQSTKGSNPFTGFKIGDTKMSSIVECYDTPYSTSTFVYEHIESNLKDWVEEAIRIRNAY